MLNTVHIDEEKTIEQWELINENVLTIEKTGQELVVVRSIDDQTGERIIKSVIDDQGNGHMSCLIATLVFKNMSRLNSFSRANLGRGF